MSDYKSESKSSGADSKSSKYSGEDDEEVFYSDEKGDGGDSKGAFDDLPKVTILDIKVEPSGVSKVTSSLTLDIKFDLDRDVVAGYWVIKFLVDSTRNRIIKILGETKVEDYVDGESDMHFETTEVDVNGIQSSALTNSGLLSAVFMANGEEVATVNMVSRSFLSLSLL